MRAGTNLGRKVGHDTDLTTEQAYRLLVDAVTDYAIFVLDPEGRVVSWNEGAQRIKGYRAEEIIGEPFSRFYPPEDRDRDHPDATLREAAAKGRYEEEGWRLRKDGSRFFASVVITALYDDDGRLAGFGKVVRDVTARMEAERERATMLTRVEAIARTDSLTGLPNRRAWDEELRREISRAARVGHPLSVALPICSLEQAKAVIDRVREATPQGQTCSAGIALWDEREDADLLVARADRALYEAKQAGRNQTIVA